VTASRDFHRDSGQELFAVVEHEQRALVAEPLGELAAPVDRGGDRGHDQVGISERRQGDEPDAVRKFVRHLGRRLNREAGLPAAARPGQRQQARAVEQLEHDLQLLLPADKRRRLYRKVRQVEGAQEREVVRAELIEVLGRCQVLEPVRSKVAHIGV